MLPDLKEIRTKRRLLGISQRTLAKFVGVSQSNIAKIELGRLNPPYSVVKAIFSFLDSIQATSMGKVADVATSPVISVGKHDTADRAIEIMQANGFKQLPVMEGGTCVGCLYERTITRSMIGTPNPSEILSKHVEALMDDALPTVMEDTPITTIVQLLQQTQAVLVTRFGKTTGIVTNADLLKVIRPDSQHFVFRRIGEGRIPGGHRHKPSTHS